MAERLPTVTVVVPVYEDVERLSLCLQLLAAQDYPASLLDVIVVDNASRTDLRPALPLGDDRFRLIREERRGSYAARNAALPLVTGDVVAFTDADCRPRPDWVTRAVALLAGPDAPDAVGGAITLVYRAGATPTTGPELYESVHGFDQRQFVEVHHFAATANLVLPRSVLEAVGPFNADLQSGGDDDFGHRLRAAGFGLRYAPDAVVEHPSRPTWAELTTKSVRVARGMAALTAGQSWAADVKELVGEARAGTTLWLTIWTKPWPAVPRAKARYASAMSWVALLRCTVRVGERLRRRTGQRQTA